jgi:hypothetical protein
VAREAEGGRDMNAPARLCAICGVRPRTGRRRCDECTGMRAPDPNALVDSTTRYSEDVAAQLFVDAFRGDATLELLATASQRGHAVQHGGSR